MATHVPTKQAQTQAPQLPDQNPGNSYVPPSTTTPEAPVKEKQHSYLSMRQMQRQQSLMGRAPIAEVVKKFRESVERFDKTSVEQRIDIFDIQPSESIKISALVFVVREQEGNLRRAAFHTVLLGSTLTKRVSQDFTVSGITFTRVGLPTEGWDAEMQNTVMAEVRKRYAGYMLINAAASTLRESFNYDDENQIQLVVTNATTAAKSLLWKTDPGATYLQIGKNFKSSFRTDIKAGWDNQVDIYGNPVRSDVVLELYDTTSEQEHGRNNNNPDSFRINDQHAATLVSNISGFIDLIWEPSPMMQSNYFGGPLGTTIGAQPMAAYTPRFIITQIDQIIGSDLVCMLISLGTTQALVENGRGFSMLLKQHELGQKNTKDGKLDIRDLGALGYDFNPNDVNSTTSGAKVNTRDPNFNMAQLAGFANSLIRNNKFLVSIDIEECGASSWAQGVFAAAATPGPNQQAAYDEIYNAANVLTAGKFGEIFQKGTAIVYDDNYRVNLGKYYNDGVARDIRDIDLVAMDNVYGQTNISEVRDWSDHMSKSNEDIHLRNALSREKIKNTLLNPVFEGYARRYTFEPRFLECLAAAIATAGLTYQTVMDASAPTGGLRAVLPFLQNIQTTGTISNAFVQRTGWNNTNQQGYAQQGIGVYANNFGSRVSY